MSRRVNLPQYFWMPHCMLADRKERCFRAMLGKCSQDHAGVHWPRAIVEGQHDLSGLQ
jgi:hypothetical protein